MKNVKLIHVSFDEVENFTPRVPEQRCPNEDETIPRICVAPTIRNALSAIPQAGEVIYYMERLHLPIVIHAYYIESDSVLMSKEVVDKVPDAMGTKEMWVTKVPDMVRRVDFELVDPVIAKRKDMNGTCERVVIGYDSLRRVKFQDNWRNLATKLIKGTDKIEHFMCNKPDISYRTFMSNMDDELLKALIRKEG